MLLQRHKIRGGMEDRRLCRPLALGDLVHNDWNAQAHPCRDLDRNAQRRAEQSRRARVHGGQFLQFLQVDQFFHVDFILQRLVSLDHLNLMDSESELQKTLRKLQNWSLCVCTYRW